MHTPISDERAVVSAVVAGDRAQFERLMRHYNRRLYRLARAALRDDAEAEDAVQEAYLCAFRSMDQFRGDSSLATWLSRLVLNECLGRLRRGARRQKAVPIEHRDDEMASVAERDSELPERILARHQMRAMLERKLDRLPENFRLVFVLRSVEELSVEETAQALGIPEATVRSRYFRARSMLRKALAHEIDLAERDLFDFGGDRCDHVIAGVLGQIAAARENIGNVSQQS